MTPENTRKFIGRVVLIDPATGQDSEYSAYVCVLLTGTELRPGITVCEAPDVDGLMTKLKTDDLHERFKDTKLTFDPPSGDYPINHAAARQRYEALSLHEIGRVQTIMSGR